MIGWRILTAKKTDFGVNEFHLTSWLSLPDKCKSFGRVMLTLGFSTGSSTQMIMEEANSKSTSRARLSCL